MWREVIRKKRNQNVWKKHYTYKKYKIKENNKILDAACWAHLSSLKKAKIYFRLFLKINWMHESGL